MDKLELEPDGKRRGWQCVSLQRYLLGFCPSVTHGTAPTTDGLRWVTSAVPQENHVITMALPLYGMEQLL